MKIFLITPAARKRKKNMEKKFLLEVVQKSWAGEREIEAC